MLTQSLIYYFLCIITFAISIIVHILTRMSDYNEWIRNDFKGNRFDYVIVGGGSAGAILAARLSENSNVSVLLIEAGGEAFDILNIPMLGPMKQLSEVDWQYSTVPQKVSCLALNNNSSKWPSGKILGGSTHLNAMVYLKGHKNDFINWKNSDSSHWDIDDITYYFNKARKCIPTLSETNDICKEEESGSITVRAPAFETQLSDLILKATAELGYTINDINGENTTGFMKPQVNVNKVGKRWTSDQYLKSVKRKNLIVLTNAIVEKILLRNGFEAYGVRYQRYGRNKTVYVNQEVIVSAGSIGSPKLLMLSGIGPKEVLAEANILTKIDLPVGKNLQDHVTTAMDLVILDKAVFSIVDLIHPSSAYRYFVHGKGPLTSGSVEAVGVVHSTLVDPLRESPDLEFMVLFAGLSSDKGTFFRHSMGISEKVWENYFKPLFNESVISILPVLLHPKSVGQVTLNPADPKGKPRIDPKYLTHKDDVKTLVEGIRIIRRMTETTAMKNFGARFNERKFPGCEFFEFDSYDYWDCYVRHLTLTGYHPVGTCKMGSLEDNGVLDHRLRVHKTNKLRVIDASVMGNLPSANTNAAVVMIAEKGADLIKEDFFHRLSSCQSRDLLLPPNICF